MRILMFVFSLWLMTISTAASGQDEGSTIRDNLVVPEGNTMFLDLVAEGVQIYRCEESTQTPGTYEWTFVGPQADLHTDAGRIGIHYAGPSWEANDGSVVVAQALERADVSDGSIPWLLLRTTSTKGNGLFSHVSFIQRIDTSGGGAPDVDSCNEEQVKQLSRIPYTARYLFYTAKPLDLTPKYVPFAIRVYPGHKFAFQLFAKGVQIYRCQESMATPGTYQWAFVEPEADLFDDAGHRVGKHYFGPTWESNDKSYIVGEADGFEESPDGAVLWLLLRAVSTQGNGRFGNITYIQRLDTVGGTIPFAMCSVERDQNIVRLPYSALYVFYVKK